MFLILAGCQENTIRNHAQASTVGSRSERLRIMGFRGVPACLVIGFRLWDLEFRI